jgi:hypothetical protein
MIAIALMALVFYGARLFLLSKAKRPVTFAACWTSSTWTGDIEEPRTGVEACWTSSTWTGDIEEPWTGDIEEPRTGVEEAKHRVRVFLGYDD